MGLNDSDVQKQIEHMIAFIDQEADEKVDEIKAKADEEFEIEKGRLVQQQRQKIISYYERKEKQLEQQKKIQQSQLINQARLKILKFREDQIQNLLNEARDHLAEIQSDQEKYSDLLLGLLAQGFFQLLEEEVTIQCRKEDVQLIESLIPKAVEKFKENSGRNVTAAISGGEFLTSDTYGGVVMTSRNGKIRVRNTLDARLEMIGQQMMPEIREVLFGQNENRKFID